MWEDEDEENAEKDDDFVSQMDENGIIGLSEALEDVELGQTCGDPGPLSPEEADPSGHERETPTEELSYNLSEHLSHTESLGEDLQILSPCESYSFNVLVTVLMHLRDHTTCFACLSSLTTNHSKPAHRVLLV